MPRFGEICSNIKISSVSSIRKAVGQAQLFTVVSCKTKDLILQGLNIVSYLFPGELSLQHFTGINGSNSPVIQITLPTHPFCLFLRNDGYFFQVLK